MGSGKRPGKEGKMEYTAKIDNGEGGKRTITAPSIDAALAEAIDWAKAGDWETPTTYKVTVEGTEGQLYTYVDVA